MKDISEKKTERKERDSSLPQFLLKIHLQSKNSDLNLQQFTVREMKRALRKVRTAQRAKSCFKSSETIERMP